MVGENPPQSGPDSPVKPFEIPALAGSFRLQIQRVCDGGAQDNPFYLLGIGQMTIDREGKITGDHQSATTLMQGQDSTVMAGEYTLWGAMALASNGVRSGRYLLHPERRSRKECLGEVLRPGGGKRGPHLDDIKDGATFDLGGTGTFGD